MAALEGPVPTRKRLIICCDGTWMDSDGPRQVPSNVTRIARALKTYGTDEHGQKIPQVIFYQNGVGTGTNSLWVKFVGGATGEGLAEHIREAYSFICQNYNNGDEIFLIGFSRGAFTARSIGSLIRNVGLLTNHGLEHFQGIFEDWEFQLKKDWKTKTPDSPWPGHRPPVQSSEYQRKMLEHELTRPNIPIKAVAVWDTVGSLGIPMVGLLPQPPSRDFAFVDTKVDSNVEYAFQALALDEHRRSYHPTVWEKPADQAFPRILKQCWFPGVHSDIGGSYPDTDLANLTLCWMVNQLEPFLDFEHDYIWKQVRTSIEKQEKAHPGIPTRPWGLGKIHDSFTTFFRFGGSRTRTPGQYRETPSLINQSTVGYIFRRIAVSIGHFLHVYEKPVQPRLVNTNESIHSSVRIRMGRKGLGYNDIGHYDSEALKGWVMYGTETQPDTPVQQLLPGAPGQMKNVVWVKKVDRESLATKGDDEISETLQMSEDVIGPFERKILRLWPEIDSEFDSMRPGNHLQNVGRATTVPILDHPEPPLPASEKDHAKGRAKGDIQPLTPVPNGKDVRYRNPPRTGTM